MLSESQGQTRRVYVNLALWVPCPSRGLGLSSPQAMALTLPSESTRSTQDGK